MKPFAISAILLLFTIATACAQTDKGTWMLSGNFSYSSQRYNYGTYKNETNVFTIQPQLGWFVSNNVVIGIAPMFNYDHETNNEPGTANYSITNTIAGGGLFLRYYLMFNQQFGFYPQVQADYAAGLNHYSASNLDAMVIPNLVFFPLPKIGVNLGFGNVGYQHQKNADGSSSNSFGLGVNGTGLTVGVSYHFIK